MNRTRGSSWLCNRSHGRASADGESSDANYSAPRAINRSGDRARQKKDKHRPRDFSVESSAKRERSSDSSSEDSEERRRNKKRRKKERKKRKKEKRQKKKRKKEKLALTDQWGKYGVIRPCDIVCTYLFFSVLASHWCCQYTKSNEFAAWLVEVKNVSREDISNTEEKKLFEKVFLFYLRLVAGD
jgi:flagellar biosynthesis GTPase FlhF